MTAKRCGVAGCNRPHLSRGLCSRHYERWRTGDASIPASDLRNIPTAGFCTVEGCDGYRHRRGLCQKHYVRLLKHGDVHTVLNGSRGAVRCMACLHVELAAVDAALIAGHPAARISERFRIPIQTVWHHGTRHLGIVFAGAGGKRCSLCVHPLRDEIEDAFLAGRSGRSLDLEYGLPRDRTAGHMKPEHLERSLKVDLGRVQAIRSLSP